MDAISFIYIPVLLILIAVISSFKFKYRGLILIIISAFTILISCIKGCDDITTNNLNKSHSNFLDTTIINLRDSLKGLHISLDSIGLKIDEKTGKILVIDSQILKRFLSQNKIIVNNNFYNQPSINDDSINYGFYYLHNKDTLVIYPNKGVWVKPFLSFDAKLDKVNGGVYQSDGMGKAYSTKSGPSEITNVNGENYKTISVYMNIVRSKSYPIILDMSGDKNQYIIFGDAADPNKRYIYQHGKVRWIPLR